MSIKGEWIRYEGGSGYFARPSGTTGNLPGVLVIQEIGGVNAHIEDVSRRVAAAGYAALAPDLFARAGTRPPALATERISEAFGFGARLPPGSMFDPATRERELAKLDEAPRLRITETFGQVFSFASPARAESLVGPLKNGFRHLHKERAETRGQKIACVGFCMGGSLSALLACEEPGLSGAAVFYGMAPPAEKIARIACPVLAFYGSRDQRVNAGIPGFEEKMRAESKSFEHHVYEGANHAFFNDDGPSYDPDAARDSFSRLLAFFLKTLKS
jgi:carboxymethylenebutenolidase